MQGVGASRNEGKEGMPSRSLNHGGSPPDTRRARTLDVFLRESPLSPFGPGGCRRVNLPNSALLISREMALILFEMTL